MHFLPKLSLHITAALAVLAGGCGIVSAQSEIRIGVIGDQTSSVDLAESYRILEKGAKALAAERITSVVHTGDLIESRNTPEQIRAAFSNAAAILNQIGAPWRLTPGDHDVNPPIYEPGSKDDSRRRLYYELYRPYQRNLSTDLWYSFSAGKYRVIALNSQETPHVDPRWGNVYLSRISDRQVAWLKQELAAHRGAAGVVVFLHQPLWYNWASWAPVHAVLRSYKVRAVIAGHFHYDQDEGEIDRIRYFVIGSAGGMIKRADAKSGGVHQVGVLTLGSRRASLKIITLDDQPPRAPTSRIDMDRVQALHVMLGDLYRFPQKNQLCVTNGVLTGVNGVAPQLSLIPVGNPIDLPVTVEVTMDPAGKFQVGNPRYTANACRSVTSNSDCVLAPGSRVSIANNSLVTLMDPDNAEPLWQSGISARQDATLQVGDTVRLTVRLTFFSAQHPHWIEGIAAAKLSGCASP